MGEAAPVLDRPQDLVVPEPDKFHAVLSSLTDDGRRDFIHEIVTALEEAQQTGNLRPVNVTLDAWWRTLQFVAAAPDRIRQAFANAATAPDREPHYTADEVAVFIGV